MSKLNAQDIVWVSEQIIRSAGLTFVELRLYRPEYGARSGLMDVSNAKAINAGLVLTRAEDTINAVRNWLSGKKIASTLDPVREAELIGMARNDTLAN